MFKAGTPVLPVSVQIDKFFFSEPGNSLMIFKGSVRTVTLKGQYCSAQCASIGHELERKVPHVTYQPFCNNSLFDARCGLSKLTYKIGIKVDSWVSDDQRGFYYTDGFNNALGESSFDKPYTYLQMGYVIFGEQKRFVTRNTVAVFLNPAPPPAYIFKRYVVMHYPINGLEIGDILAVYPGCNKDPATCVGTYDNLENFVGFPYIPTLSPVKWGLKVDTE